MQFKILSNKSSFLQKLLLCLPYLLLAIIFVIIPTVLMLVRSFTSTSSGPMYLNWSYLSGFVWWKILQSLYIAVASTILCIIIAYPFAYFMSFNTRSKLAKSIVVLLVTAPIWMSFLVKIVGLKTVFDTINGYENSTYGDIFTIIGLVYIYLPFMILPIFNVMNDMPKNLIFASKDLGRGSAATFFNVVLPYTKTALSSGITLVFLPALTTVAVPQFLNSNTSGSMIGDIIMEEGTMGQTSDISLARASTLSLVISLILLTTCGIYFSVKKIMQMSAKKRGKKYE